MAWIKRIAPADATGPLKRYFDARIKQGGRIWQIARIMSLNVTTLRASMGLYRATMFDESALSRRQREMMAVVTSQINHCVY